uniref:Uncharacterized protein n=1 Tax=Arundo donax TaxID=35708 RepID=A0A0A9CM09_ARUDO
MQLKIDSIIHPLQLGAFLQQHRRPLLLHRPVLRRGNIHRPSRRWSSREPPLLDAARETGRQLPARIAVVVEETGAVGG